MVRTLLICLLLLAAPPDPVYIHVDKTVMMAGSTLAITCRVPKAPDNRSIAAVVMNYSSSEESLNGENARTLYRFEFKRMPCGSERVLCTLTDKYKQAFTAVQHIEVAGCEP